jgi:predicted component of type VI protein secretion system
VAPASSAPASPAGETYWLALRDQPAQRWLIRHPVTIIGAAPGCDIVLPGLAPQHAEIRLENERCILYDRSGGHSWVNGRQITTANMLKEGFTVRLAAVELLVVR